MNSHLNTFLKKRPVLKNLYNFHGSFYDYSQTIFNKLNKLNKSNLLIETIIEEINKLYPGIDSENIRNQLIEYPIISYSDHHGVLHYNLLFNSNLLYDRLLNMKKIKNIIVFASGNIPMVNISYPRGFYFNESKFNFFSERKSKSPVFLLNEKLNVKNKDIYELILNLKKNNLNPEKVKFLNELFIQKLNTFKLDSYSNFSEQASILNSELWKVFFKEKLSNNYNFIYLQSNSIINKLIISNINDENSILNLYLFNKKIRKIVLKNFKNIPGCWGEKNGSFLFWSISNSKKISKLELKNNTLYNNELEIEINKKNIIDSISNCKIIPTLFIEFLLLNFTYNLTTLGGFNQVDYLPKMQKAHIKTLKEIGMNDMAEQFSKVYTKGLICGMTPFKFNSSIDMIWHYNSTNGKFNGNLDNGISKEELEKINNTKLKDLIEPAITTMMGIVK